MNIDKFKRIYINDGGHIFPAPGHGDYSGISYSDFYVEPHKQIDRKLINEYMCGVCKSEIHPFTHNTFRPGLMMFRCERCGASGEFQNETTK